MHTDSQNKAWERFCADDRVGSERNLTPPLAKKKKKNKAQKLLCSGNLSCILQIEVLQYPREYMLTLANVSLGHSSTHSPSMCNWHRPFGSQGRPEKPFFKWSGTSAETTRAGFRYGDTGTRQTASLFLTHCCKLLHLIWPGPSFALLLLLFPFGRIAVQDRLTFSRAV